MVRTPILERVKPTIKQYILNLAKQEKQWYEEYIKEKNVICENGENYINHPHDKAIKNILSDKQEAAILINRILKLETRTEIRPEEIAEYKTDFVTKDYLNREIDIIYQDLTQKNVFYLIEHQSKVDYRMSMRLIEYYNEVMKNTYKNRERNKRYEMPVIIPIIVYSGEGKWNAKTSLGKEKLPIRGILPLELGSYEVFDVNNYSDDELIQQPGILTKILSLENAKDTAQIDEKINKIMKCNLNNKEQAYLNQYIIYFIGNKYGESEKEEILSKINKEEERNMLSDVFDQVEERGIKKGIVRGVIKSKKIIITNMLKNNYTDKEIKKISEVTDEELEKIKKSLKK